MWSSPDSPPFLINALLWLPMVAKALSTLLLFLIGFQILIDPKRKRTKFKSTPCQLTFMLIVKKERLVERKGLRANFTVMQTTWYLLFIPIFRSEQLIPQGHHY